MLKTLFAYGASSFLIALLAVPAIRQLSFRVGALDYGTGRRVHDGVIPRLGGVGIWIAFAVPVLYLLARGRWDPAMQRSMAVILAAASLVLAVGIYDDIRSARIRNKLFAEVCASLILFAGGVRIEVITDPFHADAMFRLGWLSLPVTVLWIVVITNAVNLTDGLDGLAAGTGILISSMLLVLTWGKDFAFSLTLAALIGSLLGFLRHNFPPATIFMGDSGSLLLGFLLGSFAIVSSSKATAMATVMVPIIAFSHPLLDMAYAILRRYYRGVPLTEADREHIHHKLLDRGLSKKRAVLVLYLFNLLAMAAVLFFVRQNLHLRFLLFFLLVILAVAGLHVLGYVALPSFLRERAVSWRTGQKRRYLSFRIRRFGSLARRTGSLEEFEGLVDSLAAACGLQSIVLTLDGEQSPSWSWRGKGGGEAGILEFSLSRDGGCSGKVRIEAAGEEAFLCAPELMKTLAESLCGNRSILAAEDPRAGAGDDSA